jgi:hypothetical protein
MTIVRIRRVIAVLATALVVGACAAGTPSSPPTSEPSATAGGPIAAPAVVTFEVAEQGTFKVELLTQALVDHALALQAGTTEDGRIPLGTIEAGDDGVNAPWTWHLDPATFEFVDMAIEVCDGLPSYVEDKTLTSPTYCPWSATVIDVSPRQVPTSLAMPVPIRPTHPTAGFAAAS